MGMEEEQTVNLAAICTPADYNTRPLDTIYSNFIDALPVVKYCSENNKRLIHFSTCEVYGKTIGSYLPQDSPLRQDPAYYILKEDTSPCIFGSIDKQRWSYACAKQLIERLIYAEGAENGLEFTIVRPFNWIGPRMDFIPGIDGPSEGVPRVLACFSNDAIEAVHLMIENPARANGHIFNVGNPNNEVTVRQLAEMMTKVYAKVSGEDSIETPTIDVSSKEFYGEGYDDSDKRIPDMTIINKQLGKMPSLSLLLDYCSMKRYLQDAQVLADRCRGGYQCLVAFVEHKAPVLCVQWCPDKSSVFGSSAEDGCVNIWDYEQVGQTTERGPNAPPGLFFKHCGHSVSDDVETTSGGGTLQIWRMSDLIYRPRNEVLTELEDFKAHVAGCGPKA
ncbi:bifunctional polymyxin resistance protein, ArnA [Artemisia annua]|uniref:Bifunctional polymyxin resistance protein, ArnA n=1 Tax=Artemisia annua TaxID=35608 RepID=A0A2U1Q2E2_ARTAN|nr:bifunctional polymyxin resistance protein, ArnA [Artemisia annua]